VAYWDTSALVKLYVAEDDSRTFLDLLVRMDEPIVSSAITTTEVLCTLHRKEHAGALKRGGARAVFRKFNSDVNEGRILAIPYSRAVQAEGERLVKLAFAQPKPIFVRSLDVIHVSTAMSSKATLMITTDDARLRDAAALVHLKVFP
jgi:predicted nucleic acid-binding protein